MIKNIWISKVLGCIGLMFVILIIIFPMVILVGYAGVAMDTFEAAHPSAHSSKACIPFLGIVDGCYNK